jgi:cytochrome c oxidase cbb3-type subunit 1
MSEVPTPSQSTGRSQAPVGVPALPAEIDASCRGPLLLLFSAAALWLLVGLLLGLVASVKLHSPVLLIASAWLTYGRIQPAGMNALVYGFGLQAGLGVALWLLARLGRTPLVGPTAAIAGALLWNVGMVAGVLGVLGGDSTGHELLEMPGYASPVLFLAFALVGASALLTFQARRVSDLYVSQWFILAALFWWAWIYSTANLLLVFLPVRGVMQALIDWWYLNNLFVIVLGFLGLGTIFYFVPKVTGRPLHSYALALFAFWGLAICAPWSGIAPGAPLPAWMPSVSTFFTFLVLVPTLAVAVNLWRTLWGANSGESVPLKFIRFGALAWIAFNLLAAVTSIREVSYVTHFTWLERAQTQLLVVGFFALVMIGAIYQILPGLLACGQFHPKLRRATLWFGILGTLLTVLPLIAAGVSEGLMLNRRPDAAFAEATHRALMPLRLSTLGELFLLLAGSSLALNLLGFLFGACRACCLPALKAACTSES